MSDVIWAAIIAIAGSGMVAFIGARTTQAVARRTSETAIATSDRQADVELAKVKAELQRLREEYREAERSNRQGTYHRMLAILDRMDLFATGFHPKDEGEYGRALETFNNMVGGIHLFGAQPVRDALGPLAEEMERLGERIAERQRTDPHEPYTVAYGAAYREHRGQMIAATADLTMAMRADVTREILGE